ncbi:MAG: hypothetical protein LBJ23_03955 [Tannerella sp.]|jgi:serine/threonine protein kinase|nr:hypothetical protein [Tannerella sp.]
MPDAKIEDYNLSITIPQMVKDPVLRGGHCLLLQGRNGSPRRYAGGFCVVYPFDTAGGTRYAVRCWHNSVPDMQARAEKISEILDREKLPYFVEFKYVREGIFAADAIRPLIRMKWVEGDELKKYIFAKRQNPSALYALAREFLQMAATLHARRISHGDLQHGNIKVTRGGQIVLVDYDSLYHPDMGMLINHITGLPSYQHPMRLRSRYASMKADYFSEMIIYTSLIFYAANPGAYTDDVHESEGLLFEPEDYSPKNISASYAYRALRHCSEETAYLAGEIAGMCENQIPEAVRPLEVIVKKGEAAGLNFYAVKAKSLLPKPVRVRRQPVVQTVQPILQTVQTVLPPVRRARSWLVRIQPRRMWIAASLMVALMIGLGGYKVRNKYKAAEETYQICLETGDGHVATGRYPDAVASYREALTLPFMKGAARTEAVNDRIRTAGKLAGEEVDRLLGELSLLKEAYGVMANSQLRDEIESRISRIKELQPDGRVIGNEGSGSHDRTNDKE